MASLERQRGFSLVEVLAAFSVVTIVAVATTSAMITTTRLLTLNEQHSNAVRCAQEVLEELRSRDYEAIDAGSSAKDGDRFAIAWTVEDNPTLVSGGSAEEQMKLITVTVTWNWFGLEEEYRLSTVFSNLSGSPTQAGGNDEES